MVGDERKMARVNQLSMPDGPGCRGGGECGCRPGVVACRGLVVAALGPAARGGSPLLAFTPSPLTTGRLRSRIGQTHRYVPPSYHHRGQGVCRVTFNAAGVGQSSRSPLPRCPCLGVGAWASTCIVPCGSPPPTSAHVTATTLRQPAIILCPPTRSPSLSWSHLYGPTPVLAWSI